MCNGSCRQQASQPCAGKLGTVTADVRGGFNGSAAFAFTVPSGTPVGENGLFGVGETTGAKGSSSFTVQ